MRPWTNPDTSLAVIACCNLLLGLFIILDAGSKYATAMLSLSVAALATSILLRQRAIRNLKATLGPRAVVEMRARGAPVAQIAAATGASTSQVNRILREADRLV